MRLSADEILLQYPLYRTQIEEVLTRLEEACAEDLYKNSDMFEPERPTISGRPHPNATMRALEQHLGAEDADFLLFLSALVAAGREVCDGLAACRDREEMAALISLFHGDLCAAGNRDAALLAAMLTAPKAHLQQKRLSLACRVLSPDDGV